jgi:alkaline phosphatase D
MSRSLLSRRSFLGQSAGLVAGGALAPAFGILRSRPEMPCGVATGDPSEDGAVIWSRCDRPARMQVEVAATDGFRNARRMEGPAALLNSDFTSRLLLKDMPSGTELHYRVRYRDLEDRLAYSEWQTGRLRTAPRSERAIRFLWTGDTCGQGWGIDEARGGMLGYRGMLERRPDFFVHSGDLVYSDNPLPKEIALADGSTWRNLVTPAKSKVAETLDEFRGQYRYNMLDANVRAFQREVPTIAQWDDHETTNNWYPEELLEDPRYRVKSVPLLSARARRAFFDYVPMRSCASDGERIYRKMCYGPALELFVLDMRSYRGPNTNNRQERESAETRFLGERQLRWLLNGLITSKATWKVIAADMPIGLMVRDGSAMENGANGDGPPLGRELELARLLSALKAAKVRNLVWITADVHYTAAHHYAPERAVFQDFDPFWEFVSGPIHAGTFGPGDLDPTFGPRVQYSKHPPAGQANLPPSMGLQFFGEIDIAPQSHEMRVSLRDLEGGLLYSVPLLPRR